MTRNQYMAQVLTAVRYEIETNLTALKGKGFTAEDCRGLLVASKTIENVATQLRGREINLAEHKPTEILNPKGPSPLGVKVPVKS